MGVGAATPAYGRHLSAQVVRCREHYYLLDCGEATQLRLMKLRVKLRRLVAIFITHLHGDHVWGLPGLLSTLHLMGREAPLTLVGPKGLKAMVDAQFVHTGTQVAYPLVWQEWDAPDPTQPVYDDGRLAVYPLPLKHALPTQGYRLRPAPRNRPFLVDRARADEVPVPYFRLLKLGQDVTLRDGRLLRAQDYLGPPEAPISYAYCTDTAPTPELIPHLHGTTVIYHEATFMQQHAHRAAETGHSTAAQAAAVAQAAQAQALLLGHFSARYKDLDPLLAEARAVFPQAYLAEEGRFFPVPPPPGGYPQDPKAANPQPAP